MINEEQKAALEEKIESDKVCSSCGMMIRLTDIYYTLCIHMEMKDPATDRVMILETTPLDFKCRLCMEDPSGRC